jgi:hypothetical protein
MPQGSPRLKPIHIAALHAALILVLSTLAYRQYGFAGPLMRDDAIHLYSGQQMAHGIPPYLSIWDHKGPLAPMIAGIGAWAAPWLGIEDILAVRLTFFAISLLTVVGVYFMASDLLDSRAIGLVAAFTFLNFWGFGRHAGSGPRAKTAMLLFQVLALWGTGRKTWFWAGLCGSLAFLTWQPTGIYPAAAFALALLQSPKKVRISNALRALAGIAVPILAVSAYFVAYGALYEFVEGTILFNLIHLDRGAWSVRGNVQRIARAVYGGYRTMFVPIWLGLGMMPTLLIWRLSRVRYRIGRWLADDRFCALLLTAPLPLAWSLVDFQGYPDFYVFLPYVAVGLAWALAPAYRSLGKTGRVGQAIALAIVCAILACSAAYTYCQTASEDLALQRAWAAEAVARYGGERVVSIGVPEALVLLHRTNPNPYLFIVNGIDNRIEANAPGGFEGWLEQLAAVDPDVVFYGPTRGRFAPRLKKWLESRFHRVTVGKWTLYVRPERAG